VSLTPTAALGLASGAIASQVGSSLGYQPYTLSTAGPFNLFTPLLMGVSGASTSEGASVVQWPANGSLDQDWYVLPSENGYAEIVDRNSGMCLSVAGNSLTPGTQLIQWPCGEANYSQDWFLGSSGTFADWSENNWKVGVHSQLDPFLYAEVEGESPYAGAPIDQQFWDGGWNQVWTFLQA
jgi:Ricin-type beta-trefoil lectin domain-like